MKRSVNFVTHLIAFALISGCGARAASDPTKRFDDDSGLPAGVSKTEPTPEDVKRARERELEEHPAADLGHDEKTPEEEKAPEEKAPEQKVSEQKSEQKTEEKKAPDAEGKPDDSAAKETPKTDVKPEAPKSDTAKTEPTSPSLWPTAKKADPAVPATPAAKPAKNKKKMTFSLAPADQSKQASGGDGDGRLSFCHTAKWSTACLTGLLVYRCNQYTIPLTAYGCSLAATSFVGMLDMKRIDVTFDDDDGKPQTYNLPVIFTTRLQQMIEDPAVQAQIKALAIALTNAIRNRAPFDLWAWTLAANQGKTDQALEWLSVLLQDTSPLEIQIEYFRLLDKDGKLSAAAQHAVDTLSQISYTLSNENLTDLKYQEFMKLYPQTKNIEADTTTLIYHVYPMAYLSGRLKKAYGARLGSFMPFLFNTEYLNQDLDPEMWPLHHPRPEKIDLKKAAIQWKMRDMYGGLAGSLFGVGKIDRTPGLDAFQTAYAKNPFGTMQKLFWTLP